MSREVQTGSEFSLDKRAYVEVIHDGKQYGFFFNKKYTGASESRICGTQSDRLVEAASLLSSNVVPTREKLQME